MEKEKELGRYSAEAIRTFGWAVAQTRAWCSAWVVSRGQWVGLSQVAWQYDATTDEWVAYLRPDLTPVNLADLPEVSHG